MRACCVNQECCGRALALFETTTILSEILIRASEEIVTLAELDEVAPPTGGRYLFEKSLGLAETARRSVFAYLADSRATQAEKVALACASNFSTRFCRGRSETLSSCAMSTNPRSDHRGGRRCDWRRRSAWLMQTGWRSLALGRLGSGEFDLLSDADVLFVCGEDDDRSALTRSAEKMMHVLSAYTRDGTVFPWTRVCGHGAEKANCSPVRRS